MFADLFIQAHINEIIKSRVAGLCKWIPSVTDGFP